MATRLPQDFKEFLVLLEQSGIEYLLIGGYAVGLYGYARATVDMDVWISRDSENAKKVLFALKEFGFPVDDISANEFTEQGVVFQMGVPPFRLDILTSISGVEFNPAFARRRRMLIDGIEISVISLADLRENKAASGRPQDLSDLQKLKRNNID